VLIDSEIISARMLVIAALADRGVDRPCLCRPPLPGPQLPGGDADHPAASSAWTCRRASKSDYRERLLEAFAASLTHHARRVRAVLDGLAVPFCVATSSSPRRVEMSLTLVGLWHRLVVEIEHSPPRGGPGQARA
jgi:beta-phosphoglucomutase-like phosphatase (HAD superfamily)